jgi:hypothetical protein
VIHWSKKNNKTYKNSIQEYNNKILKVGTRTHLDSVNYVYIKDNIPVAYIAMDNDTLAWEHIIEIKEYRKSKDEYPIHFRYLTHIKHTKEETILKALGVAEEIYQFLQKSKINQTLQSEK